MAEPDPDDAPPEAVLALVAAHAGNLTAVWLRLRADGDALGRACAWLVHASHAEYGALPAETRAAAGDAGSALFLVPRAFAAHRLALAGRGAEAQRLVDVAPDALPLVVLVDDLWCVTGVEVEAVPLGPPPPPGAKPN